MSNVFSFMKKLNLLKLHFFIINFCMSNVFFFIKKSNLLACVVVCLVFYGESL